MGYFWSALFLPRSKLFTWVLNASEQTLSSFRRQHAFIDRDLISAHLHCSHLQMVALIYASKFTDLPTGIKREEIAWRFPGRQHFCCKRCPSMPGQEILTWLEKRLTELKATWKQNCISKGYRHADENTVTQQAHFVLWISVTSLREGRTHLRKFLLLSVQYHATCWTFMGRQLFTHT